MSEWCRYNFDLLDHERIAGADLTHLPRLVREVMREAMQALYWRAVVTLQRQRSDDGLIACHALWGPMEARRPIAEELERVGMLEARGSSYYPRNYLEKNRTGEDIRQAQSASAKRQKDKRDRARARVSHADVTRDGPVTAVCDSLSGSDLISEGELEREPAPPELERPATEPPPPGTVPASSVRRLRAVPVHPDSVPTTPPDSVPIDADLRGRCAMAGYPEPTAAHVGAMLARARARGQVSHDWCAEVVLWMARERQFGPRAGPYAAAAARAGPETDAEACARRATQASEARKLAAEHARRVADSVPPPPDLLAAFTR